MQKKKFNLKKHRKIQNNILTSKKIQKNNNDKEEISYLKEVTKKMETQIDNLKEILTQLCKVISVSNEKKEEFKGKMNETVMGTTNTILNEQEKENMNFKNQVVHAEKKKLRQKRKDEKKPLQPTWKSGSQTQGNAMHEKAKTNKNENKICDMQNE